MQGFISLNRKIINHWIFQDDKKFKWWVLMLFEVNFSDNKFILGNDVFEVKRGQSCNSLRTWAKLFHSTPKTVQEFFKLLKKDHMISYKTIGKGKQSTTLVTIENYSDYQDIDKRKVTRKQPHKVDISDLQYNKDNKENKEIRVIAQKELLRNSLIPFEEKYGLEMIEAFYRYWGETTTDGSKIKKELQDTWEVSGRLATWASKNYNKGTIQQTQHLAPAKLKPNDNLPA